MNKIINTMGCSFSCDSYPQILQEKYNIDEFEKIFSDILTPDLGTALCEIDMDKDGLLKLGEIINILNTASTIELSQNDIDEIIKEMKFDAEGEISIYTLLNE